MPDEVRPIHRRLKGFDDDELRRIPVVQEGSRLDEGATYIDLNAREPHEFTATGSMAADRDNWYVPKARVPYEIWSRLTSDGEE
jgi:hypothetical protein